MNFGSSSSSTDQPLAALHLTLFILQVLLLLLGNNINGRGRENTTTNWGKCHQLWSVSESVRVAQQPEEDEEEQHEKLVDSR